MARLPSGLDARRTRAEWSPEAVKRLILLHVQCGNKWTEISKRLRDDRSENEVKNFFYGALKAKRGFRHPLLQAYARALPVTVDKGGPDSKSRTAAYKYAKQLMASEAGEPFDDRTFDATIDVEQELAAVGAGQQTDAFMAGDAAGPAFGGRYDGGGGGGYEHVGLHAVGSSGDLHGGAVAGGALGPRLQMQPFDALMPGGGGGGVGELFPPVATGPPACGPPGGLPPSLHLTGGYDTDASIGGGGARMPPPLALPLAPLHSRHQQQQLQPLPPLQYGDAGPLPLLPQAPHRLREDGPESAAWHEEVHGRHGGAAGDRSTRQVMPPLQLCDEGRPPVDAGPGAWAPNFPPHPHQAQQQQHPSLAHRLSGQLLPPAGSQGLQHPQLQPRYSDRDQADLDHQWSGGIQNAGGQLARASSGGGGGGYGAAGPAGPAGAGGFGGYGFRRSDEVNNWDQQPQPHHHHHHHHHPLPVNPPFPGSELPLPVGGGPRGFPNSRMQAQQPQHPQQQPQAQGRWSGGTGGAGMEQQLPRLDSPAAGYRRDSGGFGQLPPPLHQQPQQQQQQWAAQQDSQVAMQARAQPPAAFARSAYGGGGGPGGPAAPNPFGAFVDPIDAPPADAPPLGSPQAPGTQQHFLQRPYGGMGAAGDAGDAPGALPPHAAEPWDGSGRDHGMPPMAPQLQQRQQQQQQQPFGGPFGAGGSEPRGRDPYAAQPQLPPGRPSSGPQSHFQHPQPQLQPPPQPPLQQHHHHHEPPHPQEHQPHMHQHGHQMQQQQHQHQPRGDPGVQRILSDVRESRQRWGEEDVVWQAMQARRRQHQMLLLQHRQQHQQPDQQQQQHQQAAPGLGPGLGQPAGGEMRPPQHHHQHHHQQPRHVVPSPFELPWPGVDEHEGRVVSGPGPLALPAPPMPMGQQQQQQHGHQQHGYQQQHGHQQQGQLQRPADTQFQPAPFASAGNGEAMPPPQQQPHEPQGLQQHVGPAPGMIPLPQYPHEAPAMGGPGDQPQQPPRQFDGRPDAPFPAPMPMSPHAAPPAAQMQQPQSQPPPPPHAHPHAPPQAPASSGLQVSSGSDLFVPGTYGGLEEGTRFGAARLPRPDSAGELGGPGNMPMLPPPTGVGAATAAGAGPAGADGFGGDTPGPVSFSGYGPSDSGAGGSFDGWGGPGGGMPPPQQQQQQQGYGVARQPSPQRGLGGLAVQGLPQPVEPLQPGQQHDGFPQQQQQGGGGGGGGGMW
ncbi:hypothetical protein HXX76_009876 [Chlamydomonas incerta]|uniref:Myb-like domain-containing protein n=1 Tax=Chlamydomonas incerta TaxID=51695 RepID=A0A835VYU5_CHLIN|nr:hypothetical protein HXX76_009876 [Chlamydomonas incerta]|eukprot:KAG2430903.1 hypothetical protein HXX76_009876 [Chlamydomonas incerta]